MEKSKWQIGDVINIHTSKNLKVTAVYQQKDGKNKLRFSYLLQKVNDEKIKYKYTFGGGLVRIY